MNSLNFVGISGSLRHNSRNSGLLRCAQKSLPDGVALKIVDLADIPFYRDDAPKPDSVKKLIEVVAEADALLLATPEYNYSVAPALKNALDWLSREPNNAPLNGKPVAMMGAGGGMGTSRAQYHLRQSFVFLNMKPLNQPEFFSNAFSDSYNDDGDLVDPRLIQRVGELMQILADWTRRLKGA